MLVGRGCPVHSLGHCRWLGGPGALSVAAAAGGEALPPAPFPFLPVRECPERPRGERGTLGAEGSSRAVRARAPPAAARLRQYMTSITRWHSHPGALPGFRQPQQRLNPAPCPRRAARGSGSAFLTLHHRARSGAALGLCSARPAPSCPGQSGLLLPGHCQHEPEDFAYLRENNLK